MASRLRPVTVAPKGMGLYDFVAQQEGFFRSRRARRRIRLEDVPRHANRAGRDSIISSVRRTSPIRRRSARVIQGACVWGTICNASAGNGQDVPDAYGVSLPGRSSCGPTRRSASRKISRMCRCRSACAPEATSMCRIGWRSTCRSNTSMVVNTGGFGAGSRR